MTGEHAQRHFKELRPGDTVDSYTGTDGRHRGDVIAVSTITGNAAAPISATTLTVDCTVSERHHTITESPWRLVAAVRKP